jgi:hypothetical protein
MSGQHGAGLAATEEFRLSVHKRELAWRRLSVAERQLAPVSGPFEAVTMALTWNFMPRRDCRAVAKEEIDELIAD